jgi:hypothetical protein
MDRADGLNLFIVFDENSTDQTVQAIMPYNKTGLVILVYARHSFAACARRDPSRKQHLQFPCQRTVFNYAVRQFAGKTVTEWMVNFDVDEFIWSPSMTVRSLQSSMYAGYDRMSIIGSVFGTSNRSEPSMDPVTSVYTHMARAEPPYYGGTRFGHKDLYRPDKVLSVDVHRAKCWTCKGVWILICA